MTLLHTPLVAAVAAVAGLSLAGLTQVALDYRHLGAASRSAARFAAATVDGRRPTNAEVAAQASAAAQPLKVDPASVTLTNSAGVPSNNPLGRSGSPATVSLTATVSPGFYSAVSAVFDGLGSLVGVKPLRPVELNVSSTATYR